MSDLKTAREWIRSARRVAALTGAGISAESGIPTFRGSGGLWKQFRAEDLATAAAFARDPLTVWEWYQWRRELIAQCTPNAGHLALAELEATTHFTLITQNVDGLHDLAGSRNILKLHGDIWRLRCTTCLAEWTDRSVRFAQFPPQCTCGGLARPAIVWFGENLPDGIFEEAGHAAKTADVFLVIGTSAQVYPAAGLIPEAKASGAKIIEINIEKTPFTSLVDCALTGSAGELLPRLI
ncbi:MAG: NAD-dependent deacylase [Acidobacteriota bacterium]|nr:NAD-dependent deacylase [Acidobacteriota bacterium]